MHISFFFKLLKLNYISKKKKIIRFEVTKYTVYNTENNNQRFNKDKIIYISKPNRKNNK